MQILAFAWAMLGLQVDASISESEFFRLIDGLHGQIRDVSLICEGTVTFVGPKSLLQEGSNLDKRYQCQYHYRHDGACRLELYMRGEDIDSLFGHSTWALLGGRIEALDRSPSSKDLAKVEVRRGTSGSLFLAGSPHYLIWLWYFQMVSGRESRSYEYQGWEMLDGHRCLRVQLNYLPGLKAPSAPKIRFWIDMARGGHPLRIEFHHGSQLDGRIHRILLDRFKSPGGREVWLPVQGVSETFQFNKKNYSDPIVRGTFNVVQDTVRMNRGLTDRVFSVTSKKGSPESDGLVRMRREFDEAAIRFRNSLPPRDPESVKERLDKELAEADRQSKMLEASSAARSSWAWSSVLPYGFSVIGVALLGVVAIQKWRGQ